tara:strand:- start:511 stop:714 length:204 start_codon:yes stop_codon:yes gene_type:complete
MGCKEVVMVREVPEPMTKEEFYEWEHYNRPPKMLWLKEYEPVGGAVPALEFRCVYEECDEVTAALCS